MLCLVLLLAGVAESQQGTTPTDSTAGKTAGTEITEGPFQLGEQRFTFVKRVLTVDGHAGEDDYETVDWWELRDATGTAVYHQSYAPVTLETGGFRETIAVGARVLNTKFGRGVLVEGEELPSAPNSGSWVQVFGMVNGKLLPFGARLATDGVLQGEIIDAFTPTAMIRGQQPQTVERDALSFKVWAGDFNIFVPVLIDWMGARVRPAWHCLEMTSHGQVDRCRKVEVDAHREGADLTFVRLFREPNEETGAPAHVVIKPNSQILYREAEAPIDWSQDKDLMFFNVPSSDDVWLHVTIDGHDGWIHSEEDFQAVGLQQAG
jgi:hypothetical protein